MLLLPPLPPPRSDEDEAEEEPPPAAERWRSASAATRAEPAARVLSVIDGPKGKAALDLALRVSNQSALVVVDDIDMTLISPEHSKWFFEAWPYASTNTRHPRWRAAFPMSRDRAAVREGGGHWAWDASYYFAEKDSAIIMLGGVRD